MNIIKNPVLILLSVLLVSCATINFNTNSTDFYMEEAKEPDLEPEFREFDLSYFRQIGELKIEGKKSVVERVFASPDNKTLYICISFPKVAVLKTSDFGKTISAAFVTNRYLEKVFGYDEDRDSDDENHRRQERKKYEPSRVNSHVVFAEDDPKKIALSIGPFLFTTTDAGENWNISTIFMDLEKDHIRQIVLLPDQRLLVFSDSRMALSADWGKKWDKGPLKIEGIPRFKTRFVRAFYNTAAGRLYVSVKHKDEAEGVLAYNGYSYVSGQEQEQYLSGLYFSDDLGKSWQSAGLSFPVVLWEYDKTVYAVPAYPTSFYDEVFSERFKSSALYKKGVLDKNAGANVGELVIILQESGKNHLELIYKGQKVLTLSGDAFTRAELEDFDAVLKGKQVILDTEYVHFNNEEGENEDNGFLYSYNPYRLFKTWTAMQTDGPVYYLKDEGGNYYRLRPDERYLKVFYKFAVFESVRLFSKNPFLRKISDVEFFHPKLDPSGGFPVILEKSPDQGATWEAVGDVKEMKNTINPAGTKRSAMFWYKTIDTKKRLKLQFAFGNQESIDFHIYPAGFLFHRDSILLVMNYFTINKSYKDMYIFPAE